MKHSLYSPLYCIVGIIKHTKLAQSAREGRGIAVAVIAVGGNFLRGGQKINLQLLPREMISSISRDKIEIKTEDLFKRKGHR